MCKRENKIFSGLTTKSVVLKVLFVFYVFVFLCSSQAWASFEYIAPKNKKPEAHYNDNLDSDEIAEDSKDFGLSGFGVAQVGFGVPEKKTSFGDRVPLFNAVEIAKPKGWRVVFNEDMSKESKNFHVSWDISDEPWINALETMSTSGASFVINWKTKQIVVGEGRIKDLAKSVEKHALQEVEVAENDKKPARGERVNSDNAKSKDVSTELETWELAPGALKKQLEKWAKDASYQLVWGIDYDYMVRANSSFKGTFTEALMSVLESLYDKGVRVYADVYEGNNVVYVKGE